jgi:hypothetical protein
MPDEVPDWQLVCAKCSRPPRPDENVGEKWRLLSNGVGQTRVCGECAERHFGGDSGTLRIRVRDLYARGGEGVTLGIYRLLPTGEISWESPDGYRDPFYPDFPVLARDEPGQWLHRDAGEAWLRRLPGYLYYRNALISAEFILDEPPDEQLELM